MARNSWRIQPLFWCGGIVHIIQFQKKRGTAHRTKQMMKVSFKLSTAAIARYLTEAKREFSRTQSFDIDPAEMSKNDLALLVKISDFVEDGYTPIWLKIKCGETAKVKFRDEENLVEIPFAEDVNLSEVLIQYRQWLEDEQKRVDEEKKEAEYKAYKEQMHNEGAALPAFLKNENAVFHRNGRSYTWLANFVESDSHLFNAESICALLPEHEKDIMLEYNARVAKKAQQKAVLEKDKEQKEENLRQWAIGNGSALLVARIVEGMQWISMAKEEWIADKYPSLTTWNYEYDSCETYERLTEPSIEEIDALREFRNKYPESKNAELFTMDDINGGCKTLICATFTGAMNEKIMLCQSI